MNTIKKIINFIFTILCCLFFGITSIFLFRKKNESDNKQNAQNKREEIKNELEKKSADDIAADSPNADIISTNITKEQEDFRKRVRDRLNQNI